MTVSSEFIMIEVILGNFVNYTWRKNVLKNNFYKDYFFLGFLVFTLLINTPNICIVTKLTIHFYQP